MRNVIIRRSPTCQNIGGYINELVSELRSDPNIRVNVVDGRKGEFTVEVDGRGIKGYDGESLRETGDIAAEIRGAHPATTG